MSEQIPEPQSPGTQDDEATHPSEVGIVRDFLEGLTQEPLPLSRSLLLRPTRAANTAEQTARNAENTFRNRPGFCLQQSRIWAGINAKYPDATTAWLHTHDRHHDRNVPRGAMAFWIGGSDGHGHVAPGVGGPEAPVRSTDAGGLGIVATRTLEWFDENWPGLHYIGWAWDLNDVTIPHIEKDWFDMATEADLRKIVAEEIAKGVEANNDDAAKVFWDKMIEVTDNAGKTVLKPAKQLLRQIWQKSD